MQRKGSSEGLNIRKIICLWCDCLNKVAARLHYAGSYIDRLGHGSCVLREERGVVYDGVKQVWQKIWWDGIRGWRLVGVL